MDITNLIVKYRLMRKQCGKRYPKKNPTSIILIIFSILLIGELIVGALQLFEKSLVFSIIELVFYVLATIIVIACLRKIKRDEINSLESYYEPLASYRIKMLCVFLLKNGLDYKSNDDIDNLINASDYQREIRIKTEQFIPNWMWSAIIGPIILFALRIYWESNSKIFENDIVIFLYCMFLIIFLVIFIAGLITILGDDSYGNLKHDLMQLKVFKEYYSNYDETYMNIIKIKEDANNDREKLESLLDSLMQK